MGGLNFFVGVFVIIFIGSMDKFAALAADKIEWAIPLPRARIVRSRIGHVLVPAFNANELHRAIFLTHVGIGINKNVAVL